MEQRRLDWSWRWWSPWIPVGIIDYWRYVGGSLPSSRTQITVSVRAISARPPVELPLGCVEGDFPTLCCAREQPVLSFPTELVHYSSRKDSDGVRDACSVLKVLEAHELLLFSGVDDLPHRLLSNAR